jgi:hypothetical protein
MVGGDDEWDVGFRQQRQAIIGNPPQLGASLLQEVSD